VVPPLPGGGSAGGRGGQGVRVPDGVVADPSSLLRPHDLQLPNLHLRPRRRAAQQSRQALGEPLRGAPAEPLRIETQLQRRSVLRRLADQLQSEAIDRRVTTGEAALSEGLEADGKEAVPIRAGGVLPTEELLAAGRFRQAGARPFQQRAQSVRRSDPHGDGEMAGERTQRTVQLREAAAVVEDAEQDLRPVLLSAASPQHGLPGGEDEVGNRRVPGGGEGGDLTGVFHCEWDTD